MLKVKIQKWFATPAAVRNNESRKLMIVLQTAASTRNWWYGNSENIFFYFEGVYCRDSTMSLVYIKLLR